MARKEKNPNQIIRIDGYNCFMEVMADGFEIGKVLMRFYKYDASREKGNRFTANIAIYMNTADFNSLYFQSLMGSCVLMKKIVANAANQNLSEWEKAIIIDRGGSQKDNVCTARYLKILKGQKKPIVLLAEEGNGQKNKNGGFTMTGKPTSTVSLGMETEDFVKMLMEVKDALIAFQAKKALSFEIKKQNELLKAIATQVGVNQQVIQDILSKTYDNFDSENSKNNQSGQSNQGGGYQNNSYQNIPTQNYSQGNGYSTPPQNPYYGNYMGQ